MCIDHSTDEVSRVFLFGGRNEYALDGRAWILIPSPSAQVALLLLLLSEALVSNNRPTIISVSGTLLQGYISYVICIYGFASESLDSLEIMAQ